MSASMAEVLAEHPTRTSYQPSVFRTVSICDACGVVGQDHQAAVLAAAGYGKLGLEGGIWTMTDAELKNELANERAKALEEAAEDMNAGSCDGNYSPEACETCRAVEMLRDRAATERGEG